MKLYIEICMVVIYEIITIIFMKYCLFTYDL